MKIKRFEVPGLAQYSYAISDGGKAAVIDPIRDIERYVEYATAEGLEIVHIFETHIHADFAAGSVALAQATGAELDLSAYDAGESFVYAMAHRAMRDGDSVAFAGVRIEALHTPGHTPEHLAFLLYDLSVNDTKPVAMFSGDCLFVGALGRPDLLGEDAKLGLAHALYASVQKRIAKLPDGLAVYPGHGAGSLCGAGLGKRTETTLGSERATNPYFHYAEAEFVEKILGSVPPMPAYYPRMKALNAAGAPILRDVPGGVALSTAQVARLQDEVTLLDLRRPEAFGGAHIAGAINIGRGPSLSLWAGWMIAPDRPIILVGDGADEADARRSLIRVGLDSIVGYLADGMAGWLAAGLEFAATEQISAAAVERGRGEAVILDVRTDAERLAGSIPGSEHVTLAELEGDLGRLSKVRPTIAVCGSGYRSSLAASLLARAGFMQVSSLAGGMVAWKNRGVVPGAKKYGCA